MLQLRMHVSSVYCDIFTECKYTFRSVKACCIYSYREYRSHQTGKLLLVTLNRIRMCTRRLSIMGLSLMSAHIAKNQYSLRVVLIFLQGTQLISNNIIGKNIELRWKMHEIANLFVNHYCVLFCCVYLLELLTVRFRKKLR